MSNLKNLYLSYDPNTLASQLDPNYEGRQYTLFTEEVIHQNFAMTDYAKKQLLELAAGDQIGGFEGRYIKKVLSKNKSDFLGQFFIVQDLIDAVLNCLHLIEDDSEEKAILLDRLSAFYQATTISWHINDLLNYKLANGTCEKLGMTKKQAAEILNQIIDDHDSYSGISWDTIKHHANNWFNNLQK